jgi:polyhydroxyalkanoate synthesis regulator phasin
MEITLKKLLLAGIGSVALTYEKAEDIINELVKKGELAVKDGKELSLELKRKIQNKSEDADGHLKDVLSGMNLATKEDIEELKKRIEELEKR